MKTKILLTSLLGVTLFYSQVLLQVMQKMERKIFKKCAACHNVASTAKHKTGPKLWNIVGAKAGIRRVIDILIG